MFVGIARASNAIFFINVSNLLHITPHLEGGPYPVNLFIDDTARFIGHVFAHLVHQRNALLRHLGNCLSVVEQGII
jgi:hypothetical protein